jgi:uncharacterized protein with LGFP repeats
MASGSLSSSSAAASSLIHPFGAPGSSSVTENTSTGSVTPPPSGQHLTLESANHPLLSHHLVMKNERHQHQHRLYQPYVNHVPLHHHQHIQHHHHHHLQQQQQQQILENHYDLSQHYPVASTSSNNLVGGTDSRCSSVSSSGGADQHHQQHVVGLTLKSEQPQQNSLDQTSSLELLDNANVSFELKFNFGLI